ncbi:MAG: ABC transporter permease [Betaproteobacteria bacterium]|nr:ABC transporter permease [Betaproteobacteria bacterium]
MKAIDRKLLRDLWQMRSQVVTVALVVGSAFSGFAGSLATYYSLEQARERFYESARFGHVFADIKRAPREIERRLAAIPGVNEVETTVVFDVTLDLAGVAEPVVGRMIGLPESGPQRLDRLVIRRGRAPERGAASEVVISEAFAVNRDLGPGMSVTALVNGRRETLHIVGVGLSPDYIFATRGGAFPDDRNFGVLWIARDRLAAAYNMEGAFNHVTVRLTPGATERAVIDALDRLLEPYGGMNAYGRDEQLSNRILSQEINQWKVTGTLLPSIFLAVAAFLLNVVLNRQVATQREQIAALKALGYGNGAIAAHYLQQVVVIVCLGIAIGIAVGYWWGDAVTALYADFFHFPTYSFVMPLWVMLAAGAVTLVAAVGGAMGAVHKAVILAPAEAMRPPSPGHFGPTLLERAGLGRLLSPAMRMVIRNMERRPLRALLTTAGMASAVAIIISGLFWRDALEYMISVQFEAAQPGDAEIALVEPLASRSRHEIARMPGVMQAEGSRDVPVRLVAGHRHYRTALLGVPNAGELRRLLDADRNRITVPPEGILLTDRLAERLDVRIGDTLVVQTLAGKRNQRAVPVVGVVRDLIGLFAYMDLDALYRLLGESDTFSAFSVRLDRSQSDALFRRLKEFPRVATVASKTALLRSFRETSARNVLYFTTILTAFASVIAIGVVYNNARIALQERAWELASLRVLGFTRGEVSTFLLGELAFELAAAIPLGCALGYLLSWAIVAMSHSDMIAIPIVVAPRTYAYAALAIVLAGAASALVVRRRIDRLDLVGVLKTRE